MDEDIKQLVYEAYEDINHIEVISDAYEQIDIAEGAIVSAIHRSNEGYVKEADLLYSKAQAEALCAIAKTLIAIEKGLSDTLKGLNK
jgi:hypothetical protein